jgi:sterol desaturase/sphingolipid hydroxylase (fatty acid hydroxylase superfamily)
MNLDYQRHARARLFQNNFLEFTSNIHPVVPFVVYGPFILAMMAWGLSRGLTTWAVSLWCIPLGWVVWDVTEYAIHRWFFHWEGSGPFTRKVHQIIHGYHHQYPDDPLRLVMPLGASIPLAIVIGGALWLADAPRFTIPGFAGFVAGYLFYDFTHWSTHARTPRTAWGKAIRSHHMAHHFAVPDRNFGISHRWIDAVVGSLKRRDRQSQESAGEAA